MKTPQMYDRLRRPTTDERGPWPLSPLVRDRKRPAALILALVLIAALVGGASMFAWNRIGDDDGVLENVIAQRDAARDQVTSLTSRLDDLQGLLADVRADASVFEGQLAKARADRLAMLGPALPDGKHFGALIAVGANQDPPRLVIDIEQWFTNQAAIVAAEEDGVFLDHPTYIRNENPRWRTIEIDPAATVSLIPLGARSYPTDVDLSGFGELFSSYEGRDLRGSPYWITMEDGKVVAIEEHLVS